MISAALFPVHVTRFGATTGRNSNVRTKNHSALNPPRAPGLQPLRCLPTLLVEESSGESACLLTLNYDDLPRFASAYDLMHTTLSRSSSHSRRTRAQPAIRGSNLGWWFLSAGVHEARKQYSLFVS
ncbi:unnamed protein product, partial [Ectocarpus sp. 13 AM-2016]